MRDPAVLAIFAVRVTAEEYARILAGAPVVRPSWPPRRERCREGVVVSTVDWPHTATLGTEVEGLAFRKDYRWRFEADPDAYDQPRIVADPAGEKPVEGTT